MESLLEIAKKLSGEFGISTVTIGFRHKKQLWSARLENGSLFISLTAGVKEFPVDIKYALVFTILARLRKQIKTEEYKTQHAILTKFVRDQATAETQKLNVAQRQKCNPQGDMYNLESLLTDVIASFPELFHQTSLLSDVLVTWGKRTTYRRFGLWHSQSRIIEISKTLDSPLVPKFVVNFILYHELLHTIRGVKKGKRNHDAQFRILEKQYPHYKEVNEFLRKIHKNRGILPP